MADDPRRRRSSGSDGDGSDSDDGPAAAAAAAAATCGGAAAAEWDEWEDDPDEDDATKSLFSDAVLPSPEAALQHDADVHGFDLRAFRTQVRAWGGGAVGFGAWGGVVCSRVGCA